MIVWRLKRVTEHAKYLAEWSIVLVERSIVVVECSISVKRPWAGVVQYPLRYLKCQNKQAWKEGLLDESTRVYASSWHDYKTYPHKAQGLLLIKLKIKNICVEKPVQTSPYYQATLPWYFHSYPQFLWITVFTNNE